MFTKEWHSYSSSSSKNHLLTKILEIMNTISKLTLTPKTIETADAISTKILESGLLSSVKFCEKLKIE